MTPLLAFIVEHPALALFVCGPLVLVLGAAVGNALSAPVVAWRKWHRPHDCPRCHGTGREP